MSFNYKIVLQSYGRRVERDSNSYNSKPHYALSPAGRCRYFETLEYHSVRMGKGFGRIMFGDFEKFSIFGTSNKGTGSDCGIGNHTSVDTVLWKGKPQPLTMYNRFVPIIDITLDFRFGSSM